VPANPREDDVADLLECLIQVKALEHSIGRIERLVAAAPAAAGAEIGALVATLASAEHTYGRVGLGRTGAGESPAPTPALAAFVAERRANLDVLRACTAADLGSPVAWPGRRNTTVADLVAIMLANDTEVLGEVQRLSRTEH
jgi:hypothetical protein